MITFIKSSISHLGGLEKYARALIQNLCTSGVSVTLLTTGGEKFSFTHPLLSIISFPNRNSLSVVKILQFDHQCQQYLKQHPTPIVFSLDRNRYQTHIRAGNGVYPAFLSSRKKCDPLWKRLSFSVNPLHRTILALEKKAFEHPDLQLLFVNAEQVKRDVLSHYCVDPEKIRVVHNGVEWKAMQPHFDAWEQHRPYLAEQFGLDPLRYQLLFLGNNFRRKGLNRLLRGLARLNNQNVQLSIVGYDKNMRAYQQFVEQLPIKKNVFFFGPMHPIHAFLQIADALVIPSYYDPFANVTVEALSMGIMVLSSKENGGHEILKDHMGQTLEDADDPDCFAAALQKILAHPKTTARAQAIRMSVEHLDFGNQLQKITKHLYQPL